MYDLLWDDYKIFVRVDLVWVWFAYHTHSQCVSENFVGSWSRFCLTDTAAHSDYCSYAPVKYSYSLTHSLTLPTWRLHSRRRPRQLYNTNNTLLHFVQQKLQTRQTLNTELFGVLQRKQKESKYVQTLRKHSNSAANSHWIQHTFASKLAPAIIYDCAV